MLRCGKGLLVRFAVVTLAWLASPVVAAAEPAISCHCFQHREFSPTQPQAFDPYLLATVQNRLLAHTFQVSRGEIVKAKMGGLTNDRLWTAYFLADAAETPPAKILAARQQASSWRAVVQRLQIDPERLGSTFGGALARGVDEGELAWNLVGTILTRDAGATVEEIAFLRRATGSLQETILATQLGKLLNLPGPELLERRLAVGSWGQVMADFDLVLDDLDRAVSALPGRQGVQ